MYNIKPIIDNDFYKLLELNYKLHQCLPTKLSLSAATITLCRELDTRDKLVVGLYKDDNLVGFINGYKETDEIFLFSNLYVEKAHRYGTRKLMEYAENEIINLGYKAWKSYSMLKEGKNVLLKFGAKEI